MGGGTAPEPAPAALRGVRVLDVATLFPAPMVAAMLGDLGADVVKVEPPSGDALRVTGAMRGGRSFVWALAGRNKRAVELDFDTDRGLELLQRLTAVADVVVLNQPPPVLERWRCTYDDIAARNPGAIVVVVSGFGADGPYAGRAGNGTVLEAYAGLTHMTGDAHGPPVLASVPIGDYLGAFFGVSGVLAALYWRDANGGTGQLVDVSIYEAVLQFLGPAMVAWSPGDDVPTRTGSRIPVATPRNVYRTRDGRWVVISGPTDAQVLRILELIGADTTDHRERFGDARSRNEHADELDGMVADWVAAHDARRVVDTLVDARIPVTEVNDVASLLADPHVRARGSVVELDDEELGTLRVPAPAPHLSRTPPRITSTGPALGAHTPSVLHDWLGEP
jgi:crotonobetainyl-CoA:carnitine CoA-transferase CaiB-like acyl-CoA transferase